MSKDEVYQREREKLTEIFKDVEPAKAQLVEGLLDNAAFLFAETHQLREQIKSAGGMVQINMLNPSIQKTPEATKQYLKNINSYSVVVKTLNGVLSKNTVEGEDASDKFIREQQES